MSGPSGQAQEEPNPSLVGTEPIVVVEGPTLSLTRQKLEILPDFQLKKCQGQSIVTAIKSLDLSLNLLRYVCIYT